MPAPLPRPLSNTLLGALLALFLGGIVAGCDESGGDRSDGGAPDDTDAGHDELLDGGGTTDAGPGSGGACTFNADCPDAERCACTEADGCACQTGARGTGESGVDACVDGNDCETSLCVEGTDDFYCSGPCVDETDCGPALPVCADIAFLGRVCIRQS